MKRTKTIFSKIIIGALIVVSSVFGACNNDNEPGDSTPDIRKKRISQVDILWERNLDEIAHYSSFESYSLSYSSEGRIKSSDYYYKYTAQYNGTNSVDEIKYVTDYVYGQDKITVTNYVPGSNTSASVDYYLKNGLIIGDNIKRTGYDENGVPHEEISIPSPEYMYDSNGRLIKQINYQNLVTFDPETGSLHTTKNVYDYIWNNNNLASIKWEYEDRSGDVYSGTLVNSYSSLSSFNLPIPIFGNYPFQIDGFNMILSLQGFYGLASKNLLESSKNNYNYIDGREGGLVFFDNYEYVFNKDGDLIKVTMKSSQDFFDSDTLIYTYSWEEY